MYVYINHQEHGQAYMNIWVVKSIAKPNTNPTPCTKGMEDSPLDSGQTPIRHWLDRSTTFTHQELITFSCLTCTDSWDGHDTWTSYQTNRLIIFMKNSGSFCFGATSCEIKCILIPRRKCQRNLATGNFAGDANKKSLRYCAIKK